METDLSQYFPNDSIFNMDDDSEEKDVYIPRGNILSSPGKADKSINKYFTQDSIFLSDGEEEDKSINKYFPQNSIFQSDGEDDDKEEEPITKRLTPRSPRRNFNHQDLQNLDLLVKEEIPNTPTIKIDEHFDDTDDSPDENIYDTPPPPLPKRNRHTLAVSTEEEKIYRRSESDLTSSRRGSCPGFLGTWERDSLMQQKYDNLLANEGLEHSAEYEFASSIASQKRVTHKKSLKDMLSTIFPNRIFLSVSDSEIDKTKSENKRDSHLLDKTNTGGKGAFNIRSVKDKMFSKYKEFCSVVCPKDMESKSDFFQLVTTFCVPAGCANVSSMVGHDHGQCWVAAEASEGILLYDRAGNLMDFVNVGCSVDSLTVDQDGNVFMSCPDLKQVRVFDRNRRVKTFLDMTQYPRGIAYMQIDNSILVCRNNERIANDLNMKACNPLRKYQIRGPRLKAPQPKDLADGRFGYPIRICVNVNADSIVSDFAHRSITVLDRFGRTRFSFKSSKDFPVPNRHSVCCDNKGNIYIFSKGMPNVCILESDGNVKDIFTCHDLSNEFVYASVFDSDGYLWVACMDGFVKIFKTS